MTGIEIRKAKPSEFEALGQLMVLVYSQLEEFPKQDEQPAYYELLANIGGFAKNKETQLLVALSPEKKLMGGVIYFSDMKFYGSGGAATKMKNASGIRLLAVVPTARGKGIGKKLTQACIQLAKENNHRHIYLHTTNAMKIAWGMYEKLGFERFPTIDFQQQGFPVFGFRLTLDTLKQ